MKFLLISLLLIGACSKAPSQKNLVNLPQAEIEMAPSTINLTVVDSVLTGALTNLETEIAFGDVDAETKISKRIILSAKTEIPVLNIDGFRNASIFLFKYSNCSTFLKRLRSCVIDIEFTPMTPGALSEIIALSPDLSFQLTANIIPKVVVIPTYPNLLVPEALSLGDFVGIKKSARVTISNKSSIPQELIPDFSALAGTNFTYISYCPVAPVKLLSNRSCQIEFSYLSTEELVADQIVTVTASMNSKPIVVSVTHKATVQVQDSGFAWLTPSLVLGELSTTRKQIVYVKNGTSKDQTNLAFSTLPNGVSVLRTNCYASLRISRSCYVELQFSNTLMTEGPLAFEYTYSNSNFLAKLNVVGTVIGGLPPSFPCTVADAQSNGVNISNSSGQIVGERVSSDVSQCLLGARACDANYDLASDSKSCMLLLPYILIPTSFDIVNGFGQTIVSSMNNMSVNLNGEMYIVARDGLYKLNSSNETLGKVATFYQPSGNGNHHTPVVFNNKIYFPASDNASAFYATEIWESDGTAAGTQKVASTIGHRPTGLTASATHVFYRTGSDTGFNIYKLDSNNISSVAIASNSTPMLTTINGNFLYTDFEDLFIYNGSFGSMIKKINPSGSFWGPDISNVIDYVKLDEKVYFSGKDAAGSEPWVTDGTSAGTYSLTDLTPGGIGSNPRGFLEINGKIFFMTQTSPVSVYSYDPATSALDIIKTFPVSYSIDSVKQIQNIVKVKSDLIVFAIENNGVYEIWQTNGTGESTILATGIFAELSKNLNMGGYFRMIELTFEYNGVTYLQVNFADSRGKQFIRLLQ